jgi:hypothetical protein
MKYPTLTKAAAVLITIVLLAILLSQVNVADVIAILVSINPLYLVAGFFLYVCSYVFRTLRFHVLLKGEVGLGDLFRIVCVHNMVNSVLPARTGELSYVYLLKKVHQRTIGDGVATLVVARIFDFVIIVTFFFLAFLFMRDAPSALAGSAWVGGLVIVVVIILLALLLYSGRTFFGALKLVFEKFHIVRWNSGKYLLTKAEETVESLDTIKSLGLFKYLQLLLISCGIWLSLYSLIYLLVIGMGIPIAFLAVLFASTFSIISTVLPVQGIGGFGTVEGAWTIGFMLIGLTKADAIGSGFSYHIVVILYFVILGIYGLLALKSQNIIPSGKQ